MADTHSHTALLVMDMQEGIVARLAQQGDVLTPVHTAIDSAHAASVPVIYVVVTFRPGYPEISPKNKSFSAIKQQQSSLLTTRAMEIHSALAPQPTDIVVTKRRVGAFSRSDLEVVLRAQDISHLVLCGISTKRRERHNLLYSVLTYHCNSTAPRSLSIFLCAPVIPLISVMFMRS